MREHSFATLVTRDEGSCFATHLPLLLEAEGGESGRLVGHVARANPQWEHLRDQPEALAIFQGPHAYVSPSWYETELSVPTWNYTAVHAYGAARLIEGDAELLALLRKMVAVYEAGFEEPWPFALPEDYTRKLLRGIVGFEIRITRLEGKFKLGQNRPEGDRQGVIDNLKRSRDGQAPLVARLMAKH
jgi:transcriptional regulator